MDSDFPDARYVFVVHNVPAHPRGCVGSLLAKTKLFADAAGIKCEILTTDYSVLLSRNVDLLRKQGRIADGVVVHSMYDLVGGDSVARAPVTHDSTLPGLEAVRAPDTGDYRYYEHGIYKVWQRFAEDGSLVYRDYFNENRARTRRDEFGADGHVRRTVYYDLHFNVPRQEIYYRADGTAFLNQWLGVDDQGVTTLERVTLFDVAEKPVEVFLRPDGVLHLSLDKLIGDDRAFVSVEGWASYPGVLNYSRPNVKKILVMHETHLNPGETDLTKFRPRMAPALQRWQDADAIVAQTNGQCADIKAACGDEDVFCVVPHVVEQVPPDPAITRDPNLVVVVANLAAEKQKQLTHALRAFKKVVAAVPSARLAIYGHGLPAEVEPYKKLARDLGIAGAVTFPGYVQNVNEVYQWAALSMLTSSWEALGLVVVESLANGCPVVSYDMKYGPAEIIRDGETGLLVPPGDIKALAAAVIRLLKDPALSRRMGDAGRGSVSEYGAEAFRKRWAALFARLDATGWPSASAQRIVT